MEKSCQLSDVGLIGLAVMGENLVLNMESHGFHVSVWNRTYTKTQTFESARAKGKNIQGFEHLEDFVNSIAKPRKIIIMVKAGTAVDDTLNLILPLLAPGDILMDGGNSYFKDTQRRSQAMPQGITWLGCGISGGEEGALKGPSLMPSGNPEAYQLMAPILDKIAAKASDGTPCCSYLSGDGSGHFVKMVHNGIEYADMQLIAETYGLFKSYDFSNDEIAHVFDAWNQGPLGSYLIEISAYILRYKDAQGRCVLDDILPCAGQKGTGKWSTFEALDLGIPLTTISEAVFARVLSDMNEQRTVFQKNKFFMPSVPTLSESKVALAETLFHAVYAAKITIYAQGFSEIQMAKTIYHWDDLNLSTVASLWRGGCIIRATLLNDLMSVYQNNPNLQHLLITSPFEKTISNAYPEFQKTIQLITNSGIPAPVMMSAFAYLCGLRQSFANLIQAQRDLFGAHTYERVDAPRGNFYHTDWLNLGGSTTASTYNS